MTQRNKIALLVIPVVGVLALGTYFNRDTMHVTNIPQKVAEKADVTVDLTPEQMIAKVTKNIENVSIQKMKDDKAYLDYADYMQGEINTMTEEANRLFDIASSTNNKLNEATTAYQNLRDLLNF